MQHLVLKYEAIFSCIYQNKHFPKVDKDTSSITTIIDKPETDIEELCTVLLDNNSVLPTDSSKSVVNLSKVDIDTIGKSFQNY